VDAFGNALGQSIALSSLSASSTAAPMYDADRADMELGRALRANAASSYSGGRDFAADVRQRRADTDWWTQAGRDPWSTAGAPGDAEMLRRAEDPAYYRNPRAEASQAINRVRDHLFGMTTAGLSGADGYSGNSTVATASRWALADTSTRGLEESLRSLRETDPAIRRQLIEDSYRYSKEAGAGFEQVRRFEGMQTAVGLLRGGSDLIGTPAEQAFALGQAFGVRGFRSSATLSDGFIASLAEGDPSVIAGRARELIMASYSDGVSDFGKGYRAGDLTAIVTTSLGVAGVAGQVGARAMANSLGRMAPDVRINAFGAEPSRGGALRDLGPSVPNLTERGTLTNLRPNDLAVSERPIRTLIQDDSGRYWLQSPGGNRITPSGSYDFVTMPDGSIRVTRPNITPDYSTHLGLSGGGEVNYAGSIRFGNVRGENRGTITEWTNNSGHYRPPAQMRGNANLPLDLFRKAH
jgi:hypothetical protein